MSMALNCDRKVNNTTDEASLQKFRTFLAKELRENIEYETGHQIEREKKGKKTLFKVYKNFSCELCCNFYTGRIDVKNDSLFLIAQYGYLGKEEDWPTVYTTVCTHIFEYTVDNLPDTITNYIFREITSQ